MVARIVRLVFAIPLIMGSAMSHSIASGDASHYKTMVIANHTSADLAKELTDAYLKLGPDYKPRTEHFLEDGAPRFLNRLIREDSPYLLQHAHNPVNWYPWGNDAIERAKLEDKPIFLSIGYATCHWCHVMERESFENEEIAQFLNEHFIAIKVDREQRPDVDSTYMTAVQMMTGSGGWPLNSFLNIKSVPFYGGTYFPPESFLNILQQIETVWDDSRDELEAQASKVESALKEVNTLAQVSKDIGETEIKKAVAMLLADFDSLQGGFGGAPKFPRESAMYLLLEYARRTGNVEALEAAHFSLERIAAGGIHDQIAGGFHRYSVDDDWLVPHFEKMLYNQAALARNFLSSFSLTGDSEQERVVRRTLDYVLREMTSSDNVFYSATDADSEGGEGLFFIWTPEELREVLSEDEAKLAEQIWDVTEHGNFEESNILHLDGPLFQVAKMIQMDTDELISKVDTISEKLLAHRQSRIPPLLDDKIITAWNGMMITALVEAGERLQEPRYLDAGIAAAKGILKLNSQENGRLWRTHYAGASSIEALQNDYAYFSEALIALHDATGEAHWLQESIRMVELMNAGFWDKDQGAYFMGTAVVSGADLPVRPKERYDNAIPAGNSVALRVLAKLYHRTGEDKYQDQANRLLNAFSGFLVDNPVSFGYLLTAVSELQYGETGHRQYAARGKVRLEAAKGKSMEKQTIQLKLTMADGWHINANKPLQSYLVGTSVMDANGKAIEEANFPVAKIATLGFQRAELALYENTIEIDIPLSRLVVTQQPPKGENNGATPFSNQSIPITVNLQACDDKVCLAPETVTLNLSLADPIY